MTKNEPGEYEDVINFVPAPLLNIERWEVFEIHANRDYYPIMNILLQGPKTVRELTAAYAKWCKERGSPKPKSDKTIYRYLKNLGKHGLVVPAGKRVAFGKTATETLYARSADFIRYQDFPPHLWESRTADRFVEGAATGLEWVFGEFKINRERFKNFLIEFEDTIESYIHDFIIGATKEEHESVRAVEEHYFIDTALKYMGIFSIILKHPEIVEKLRDSMK